MIKTKTVKTINLINMTVPEVIGVICMWGIDTDDWKTARTQRFIERLCLGGWVQSFYRGVMTIRSQTDPSFEAVLTPHEENVHLKLSDGTIFLSETIDLTWFEDFEMMG